MLYFPQLVTGAVGQFPGTGRVVQRTVVNESADGRTVKLADAAAEELEWLLEFAGLTDAEWQAFETLFEAVEGQLSEFTFLDPFDNLLTWSEDLTQAVWTLGGSLTLTPGVADPLGGTGATQVANPGGTSESIEQSLSVPGWFHYCVSAYARAATPATITLFQSSAGGSASKSFDVGPSWKQHGFGTKLDSTDESIQFGVTLAPGSTVELFGLQVEAQVGASKYKKTTTRSGIHASARFATDVLARTAEGIENSSCRLRIRAGE
jgi:hypothetical protein